MPSPLRWQHHASPNGDINALFKVYQAHTPGTRAGVNGTLRIDFQNEFQPDATLVIEPEYGGQLRYSQDDYLDGAPELVAEVTASTVSIDLNTKLRVYQRNRVCEYLVWRIQDQAFDWFVLRQGNYDRLSLNALGHYQSEVFPGLWLDPAALVRFDLAAVLQVLMQGLASPEHTAFVTRLQQARKPTP